MILNFIVFFVGGIAIGWIVSKLHTAEFDKKYKKNLENWFLQFHVLNKKIMTEEIVKFKSEVKNEISRAQQEFIEQAEKTYSQEEEEYFIDLTKKDDDSGILH